MLADLALWATKAETADFWMVTAIPIVAAIPAFIGGFWYLRKARLMEDTPTSRIRSAAQGYVELDAIGRLIPGPEIVSPLTSLPCLWWTYRIERKVTTGSGKNRRTRWQTIAHHTSNCLFELDDDTGKVVVDPDGAKVVALERDRWYGHSARWSGPPKTGVFRSMIGDHRFTEERLARNRPIYALGWFKTVGGAGDDFDGNEEVRQKLAAWKQDRAALLERFDADGDGEIDMDEWDSARRAAEQEVREEQLERALKPGVNVLCVPPKHHDNLFLLSAVPQEKLVSRYRKGAAVCIVLFLVAGAVAAWLIGARASGL